MSEDQPKQPHPEQPEAQTPEVTETVSQIPESPPQQKSPTQKKSVVPKPGFWQQVLGLVRSFLPGSVGQKLSDGLLTVAIAAIALILVVIVVSFPSGKSATELADIPVVETPELPFAIAPFDPLLPTIDADQSQMTNLASPGAPQPVELTTPPPPKLTPEQFLIVSIKNQIADITNKYGGGFIESLKVDFPSSLLIVELSNDWYDLSVEEQDKLANQMLQQAQDLDFSKLQVINSLGRMVARSPVIGSDMIILERSLLEIPG